jgi:hypothetical protein
MSGYQLKENIIMNNIFVVKTIPEKATVKEKYKDAHVWDIFWQCKNYYKKPFRFYLLTNFTTVNHPEIKIVDISNFKYDGWWNKMLLFHPDIDQEGTNLYFDLDTTFHRDISDIDKYITPGLLTSVFCYWKPIDWLDLSAQPKELQDDPDMKYPSMFNSSVMGWQGHTLTSIWDDFKDDDQRYLLQYRGNDDYLGHKQLDKLKALPRGICYSQYYGADVGSEFFPRDKKSNIKRDNYYIRLLNGPGKD